MRISIPLQAVFLLAFASALAGCVSDRAYRKQASPLKVVPEPPKLPADSAVLDIGGPCNQNDSVMTPMRDKSGRSLRKPSGPCIAYIEFNDQGKQWVPADGALPSQLDRATALIKRAIDTDPLHQPIIVTSIHGWKHNASPGPPEDANIQGFEHVLNYLYTNKYGGTECNGMEPGTCTPIAGHVVVGIYIGWRGESVSHYWPVARTFSLYSRGSAANRVGRGDLPDALKLISRTAHPPETIGLPTEPMLVFVGHSFGARVLENAMNKLYIEHLDEAVTSDTEVPTFADLVLYVNSAASSTVAVPMLNYLADHKLEYREDLPDGPPRNGMGRDRPLMLSITTPADAATGMLFPIAMGGDGLVKKVSGSLSGHESIECFDPKTQTIHTDTSESQFKFYSTTAAHLELLQTHDVVDIGTPPIPGIPSSCPAAPSPDSYSYGIPSHCFRIEPKQPLAGKEYRCNNTPYWIVNTDGNIIPDHGTIFTDRLLRFIGEFLPPATASFVSMPRLATKEQTLKRQMQLR